MIAISRHAATPGGEFEITAIRAQGTGGQHVNKTSTAIHLRFGIRASSLPEYYKEHLLAASRRLISSDGVIVIKTQEYRNQELNHEAALARLAAVTRNLTIGQKARRPTRPTRASKRRRLTSKAQESSVKAVRSKMYSDQEQEEEMDGEKNDSDSDGCNQPLYSDRMQ